MHFQGGTMDITARDLMATNLLTFTPDQDIHDAIDQLLRRRVSGGPVLEDGRLVGILSEKDCLKVLAAEAYDGLPEGRVADFMTKPVESVLPDTSVYDIVGRFLHMPYRRLPVIDEQGRLLGQISRRDVLRAIESIRENSYLYGSAEHKPMDIEAGMGVDTAMRLARGR